MATRIENLPRLKRRLHKIPIEIREEVAKAHEKNGQILVEQQRQWVPVRTERLQEAHRYRVFKRLLRLRVSVNEFYASFQEFGTSQTPAQPWFFPAYRVLRRRMRSRLTRGMNKGIKRAIKTR